MHITFFEKHGNVFLSASYNLTCIFWGQISNVKMINCLIIHITKIIQKVGENYADLECLYIDNS